MRLACFLFTYAALSASAQGLDVRTGVLLKTSVAGHSLVLNDVFLNGAGPFRMLIDTGNASSIVRPQIARRLNLSPAYSVDQVSVAGVRRVPVAILDEVRAGSVSDRSVEAMIGDVFQPGVDGVLGESWLVRHDYLLDYRNRRIGLDGPPPASGIRAPLRSGDGRPVVVVSVEGSPRELVVDSGASALVLYEKAAADGGPTSQLQANGGTVRAQACTVHLSLPGARERLFNAVRIDLDGLGPGLLPASAYASVFVSNREGFVEFDH
jgi:predicted aspartyl protease